MKDRFVFRIMMVLFCVGFLMTGSLVGATSAKDIQSVEAGKSALADLAEEKEKIASDLAEEKAALEEKQGELARVVKEKAEQMTERDDLVLQIEHLYDSMQELEATITDIENEYNNKLALFKARAEVMYQFSNYTTLQMFIESDSLLNFLNRESYYSVLLEKDKALMDELETLQEELENKKSMQEKNKLSYEALLKEKDTIIEKLENDEDYLTELSSQSKAMIDELEAKEDEMQEESRKIEERIKALQSTKNDTNKGGSSSSNGSNGSNGGGTYTPGQKFLWPSEASRYISSYFGMRMHPIYHYMRMHNGIDIAAPGGTNILAAESGTVIVAEYNSGYGNYIIVDHGGGFSTLYAHSSRLLASVGDYVSRGQVIALVGTTGNSTGNHLHFEVRVNGTPTNPLDYL